MKIAFSLNQVSTVKLKLSQSTAFELLNYLNKCYAEGFTNGNFYSKHEPIRECLLRNAVLTLGIDLFSKINKAIVKNSNITLSVSYAQRVAFSVMIKRIELPPILQAESFTITNHLII